MSHLTKAHFLQPGITTPVFTRFSTVAGSRGASDLTGATCGGFSVKFYTQQGVYDLVGNNMPVFFMQDATKFPDFIHAVKPEPHNEIPQGASAHDTFYDYISANPEATHMLLWVMSDRALPRSLRMMEGFGVHSFRLVNDEGKWCFVKFHWKPLLGTHSVAWEEAQQISGKDQTSTAATCGPTSRWAPTLSGSWAFRWYPRRTSISSISTCWIPPAHPGGAGAGAAHRQDDA